MRIVLKNHTTKNTALTLLVFLLMFVSNDTFLFGSNSQSFMIEVPRILMGIYIVWELLHIGNIRFNKNNGRAVLAGIAMAALMVLISFYHGDSTKIIIIKVLCILSSLLLTLRYRFEDYAEAFFRSMVFLAIMSLLLGGLAYTLPSLVSRFPRMINTAGSEIITIGFAGITARDLNGFLIRSFGIFWEPGVFQMYLNLAIVYELFTKKAIRWKSIAILSIAVFLTFSTTGFVVWAWIFAIYLLLAKKEKITGMSVIGIAGVLALVVASIWLIDYSFIGNAVLGKLTNEDSGSTIARSASVFVNLDVFFDHPWVGVGVDQLQVELVRRSALMYERSTIHNTNTLLYQFAAHGIFYGGLFLLGTCRFVKHLSQKRLIQFAMIVFLVLIYVGENLRYSMFPFILIFYGFAYAPTQKTIEERSAVE